MSVRPVYVLLAATILSFIAFLYAPNYDADERSDFEAHSTTDGDWEFVSAFHAYGIRAAFEAFPQLSLSEFVTMFTRSLFVPVARDILYITAFVSILQLPLLASTLPIPVTIRVAAAAACGLAALVSGYDAFRRSGGVLAGHQFETARAGAYIEVVVFLLACATLLLRIRTKA